MVKLIAEGHTSEEIAEQLFISKKTVDRHRANILEKLGMRNRVELTRYAIRRGTRRTVNMVALPAGKRRKDTHATAHLMHIAAHSHRGARRRHCAHGFDPDLLSATRKRARTHAASLARAPSRRALAGPGIGHTAVVHLTTPSADGPREHGWLLDCELLDAACPPSDTFRELLTDMRLVGFDPIIFMAQPQPV